MSAGTTKRPIRISDELWEKAQEKAAEEGTNVSSVIRSQLEEWVSEPRLTLDEAKAQGQTVEALIDGTWWLIYWEPERSIAGEWLQVEGGLPIAEDDVEGVRLGRP